MAAQRPDAIWQIKRRRPAKRVQRRLINPFELSLKVCAEQLSQNRPRQPLRQVFNPAKIHHLSKAG
ncbi:hypothetical protein V474_23605 [Novosphingobium barchaimii LL02]|uniref:Uncharacterized protein n=1 Tax=Novosphingobium barchaimii LL02 TaxID=1114963 RepID=A0A0J7XLR6_9SPHN|nr:hypothetical protein V474_23605 [Novosphingobium barchaimii LL02]